MGSWKLCLKNLNLKFFEVRKPLFYGAFYGYSNTQIFLSTVDCRASAETDSVLLAKNLEKALNMILSVMREA